MGWERVSGERSNARVSSGVVGKGRVTRCKLEQPNASKVLQAKVKLGEGEGALSLRPPPPPLLLPFVRTRRTFIRFCPAGLFGCTNVKQ